MKENTVGLVRQRQFGKMLTATARSIYGLCLLVFLSLAFIPLSWVTYDQGRAKTIIIVNPLVSRAQLMLALFCFALLLLLGVLGLAIKRFPAPWVALILALVCFPASCGIFVIRNLGPWTTEAEIKSPDNSTYYFMDSSFMQGQTMALAKLKEEAWLTRSMDVVGTTNGDEPRNWASVIRPVGTQDRDYGQLYVSADKTTLIGIRSGFRCFMSYDFQSHHFRGKPVDDAGDIKGISPFILIGEKTEMDAEDVKGVVDHIKSHTKNNNDNGYPRLNVIEAALDHPNTKVRLLAKELITIIRSHEKERVL
jgi:hypothetical protein